MMTAAYIVIHDGETHEEPNLESAIKKAERLAVDGKPATLARNIGDVQKLAGKRTGFQWSWRLGA